MHDVPGTLQWSYTDARFRLELHKTRHNIIKLFITFGHRIFREALNTSSAPEDSACSGTGDEWDILTHPPPDDEDTPTPAEVEILENFVSHYGTLDAMPVSDAARRLMSHCDEDAGVEVLHQPWAGFVANKGERIGWFLWDAGLGMPRYQPAILELVDAIQALPTLDRTEQQMKE